MKVTLRTISSIELTNFCNLKCKYCINRRMKDHDRKYEHIQSKTWYATLNLIEQLVKQGSQQEVSLQGNGESCLHPFFLDAISKAKSIMGKRMVFMCTNGEAIVNDPDLPRKMKFAGLDRCDLSVHRPDWARTALQHILRAGLDCIVNPGAITHPHNWAGQLESENNVDTVTRIWCDPLKQGRGYVQSHGGISPCCYDYRGLGQFGTVFDDDILQKPIKPYALCNDCHQVIPEYLKGV